MLLNKRLLIIFTIALSLLITTRANVSQDKQIIVVPVYGRSQNLSHEKHLLTYLLSNKTQQAQEGRKWTVCGKLVDKSGNPVYKGVVYPGGDTIGTWSDVVEGVITDISGRFCLELISNTKKPSQNEK